MTLLKVYDSYGTLGDATGKSVADYAFDNADGTTNFMTYSPIEDFGTFSVLNANDFYYLGSPYPNNIGIEEMEIQNFSVSQNYPNPDGVTKIAIESIEAASYTLNITDLSGRVIDSRDLGRLDAGRHIETIDASTYAPGFTSTLFLQLDTKHKKFIVGNIS